MTSRLAPINSLPVRAQARAIPSYNRLLVLLIPNPCCPCPPAAPSALYNVQEDNHRPHVQRQRQVVVLHAECLQTPRQPSNHRKSRNLFGTHIHGRGAALRQSRHRISDLHPHAPRRFRPFQTPATTMRRRRPTPQTPRSPRSSWDWRRTSGVCQAASPQSRPMAQCGDGGVGALRPWEMPSCERVSRSGLSINKRTSEGRV